MNTTININKLAEAIGYNEISATQSIMMHKSSGDFAIVEESKLAAREAQGWVECVSAATLESLGIQGDTSDDGMEEANIIYGWMSVQP